jgi:hypothetical protein
MKNEDVIRHSSLYSLEQENNNPVVGSTCFPVNVLGVTENSVPQTSVVEVLVNIFYRITTIPRRKPIFVSRRGGGVGREWCKYFQLIATKNMSDVNILLSTHFRLKINPQEFKI